MPVSDQPLAERIARVLAAAQLSSNAEGDNASAASEVDRHWRDHLNQSLAVLHAMREPDRAMAETGDEQVWSRMIDAAIRAPAGGAARD